MRAKSTQIYKTTTIAEKPHTK